VLGCALILAFAVIEGGGRPSSADALLLAAVMSAAIGNVSGAKVSTELPGEQIVSWVLVRSLPLMLPAALLTWPDAPVSAASWGGFAYVSLFSMWIGFLAWYRGLAMGSVIRVSQVPLLQPFIALLAVVPILGERLDATTVGFALAVIAVVFVGRRMPVGKAG
jgi:drug/metabolite transporter (DMT)-like permease